MRALLVALVIIGSSACGARGEPIVTPRQIAGPGIEVLTEVDEIGETAKALYGRKLLTGTEYRVILERVIRAHQLGSELADILLAVDEGTATVMSARRVLEQLAAVAAQFRTGLDGEALDAITKGVGRVEKAVERIERRLTPAAEERSAACCPWRSAPSLVS